MMLQRSSTRKLVIRDIFQILQLPNLTEYRVSLVQHNTIQCEIHRVLKSHIGCEIVAMDETGPCYVRLL